MSPSLLPSCVVCLGVDNLITKADSMITGKSVVHRANLFETLERVHVAAGHAKGKTLHSKVCMC